MSTKISNAQISEVLTEASATLQKVAAERDYWKKEAQTLQLRQDATKLAEQMHYKGVDADTPIEHLVARIEKVAEEGKLTALRDAVDLIGPDMGSKLAQLTNDETRNTLGSSDLERFIVGDMA